MQKLELRSAALSLLAECDIISKTAGVNALYQSWLAGDVVLDTQQILIPVATIPGRPDKPELISPQHVKRRALNTVAGRAVLLHALAHIEFNAINLALDVMWRFVDMPQEYYANWLQVAYEEVLHFSLLNAHLQTQGYAYGDFPAHDGLWDIALKTSDNLLARLALVPRTLEARGLDVVPGMRYKLAQAGDIAAAEILDIILRDEIGHVRIGNYWFNFLCQQQGSEVADVYAQLLDVYQMIPPRVAMNRAARLAAGFSEEELLRLQ